MADVSQITDQLWTGGAITSDHDVAAIAALGITADADMRLEFDDKSLVEDYDDLPPTPNSLKNHPKIAYLYNGVADDGQPKPVGWFQMTYAWAKPIHEAGGVILCHCAAGVNRGPSMTYFLMRSLEGMPGDSAFSLIQQKRPIAEVLYRKDADDAIVALGLDTTSDHNDSHLTSDRNDPRLTRGVDDTPVPQADAYLVLSEEERLKGFVRPFRDRYVHEACGAETRMGIAIAQTYARNPHFYGATYCCSCRMHRPVGQEGEFVWPDGSKVGT